MSTLRKFAMRKDNALIRLMIMLVVPAMLITPVTITAYAQSGSVIYDGKDRQVVFSEATEPSEILAEAGIELTRADIVEMDEEGLRTEITVRRNLLIRINNGGQSIVTNAYGGTVGELLEAINLQLNEGDAVDQPLETQVYDGMDVKRKNFVWVDVH